MYESFFGLQHEPFSIAPDPRFLYMSDKHREALALLHYGLHRGASFVLLTGEIGAGKTTVWRRFVEELPSNVDVANVVNPKLGVEALLTRICQDLNVAVADDERTIDLIDVLHGHLLLAHAQGRRTLVVIDEAQALSLDVLEQLRLLTNLDSSGRKLQIMLIGQPELRQMLARPQLEPVAQRVVSRYHLPALSASETAGYIVHRLGVAGLTAALPFDEYAIALIHRLCGGVPRRINVLCDRALTVAQAAGSRRVDRLLVERAARDAFGEPTAVATASLPPAMAPVASAVAGGNAWVVAAAAAAAAVTAALIVPRFIGGSPPAPAVVAALATPAPPAPSALPTASGASVAPPPAPATPTWLLPSIEAAFSSSGADEALNLRTLAGLWHESLGAGEPCSVGARRALPCHRSRGGLATIRQLDRPSLLKLADEGGRVSHVLLTGLGEDSALLTIAGVERSVPLLQLAQLWRGEFTTFWRAPPGYVDPDRSDTAGAAGSAELDGWVGQHLARVDGSPVLPDTAAALRARVAAFQLAQGLTPDGVAGPLTLMKLNRASGIDEPRLRSLPPATSGNRPA